MVDSQPEIGNEDLAKQLDELESYERESSKNVLAFNEQKGFEDNI